ncbi:MAG: hypothetical protein ACTS78_00305 [Arsenophonus sp. NC-WZS1-MAG3]
MFINFYLNNKINAKSLQRYEFALPADIIFPAFDRLANQQFYPQFYWYHRDGHEKMVLLSEIKRFSKIAAVERFLQEQAETTTMQI